MAPCAGRPLPGMRVAVFLRRAVSPPKRRTVPEILSEEAR
jgi:hypothetical protein